MKVFAEVSENHKRIEVWFPYSQQAVAAVKALSGAKFVPKDKSHNGTPFWSLPLDISVARQLRQIFGNDLKLGNALRVWGQRLVAQERQLKELSTAASADLVRLPELLPELYVKLHVGPKAKFMSARQVKQALRKDSSYQAADVMFGVVQRNPLNGNEPGLGKTLETIGSIFEGGTDAGPTLVVAPKTALNSTWRQELESNQPHKVVVSVGTKAQKLAAFAEFEEYRDADLPVWLVVNPDQVRYREIIEKCPIHAFMRKSKANIREFKACLDCVYELISEFPVLHETAWSNIIIDEAHKNALRHPDSLTAQGMNGLKVEPVKGKRFALTGTAMGGKIINLYGILHWLNPDVFSSKWRFAGLWCDLIPNKWSRMGEISNSLRHCQAHQGHDDFALGRPECDGCRRIESDFYDMLQPYLIRRTKAAVAPWLPPKDHIEVWCDMTDAQERVYREFAEDSAAVIDDIEVTASSVLAEFVRLKQFAFGVHKIEKGKLMPTVESGKLESVLEKLDELGVIDGESDEQVVIFSQFATVVNLVHDWLQQQGVRVARITGSVNQKQRDAIQADFQGRDGARVLVMTTTAGGVSITLDNANTVFILDETWDPDDQTQAEDRVHRVSRIHQVTVYTFRTLGTIEEYIMELTSRKAATNASLDELRRVRII
ncbi:MAG TPA: DEAD/DEAH box helicase [Ktedonobacteraceae bacterium]